MCGGNSGCGGCSGGCGNTGCCNSCGGCCDAMTCSGGCCKDCMHSCACQGGCNDCCQFQCPHVTCHCDLCVLSWCDFWLLMFTSPVFYVFFIGYALFVCLFVVAVTTLGNSDCTGLARTWQILGLVNAIIFFAFFCYFTWRVMQRGLRHYTTWWEQDPALWLFGTFAIWFMAFTGVAGWMNFDHSQAQGCRGSTTILFWISAATVILGLISWGTLAAWYHDAHVGYNFENKSQPNYFPRVGNAQMSPAEPTAYAAGQPQPNPEQFYAVNGSNPPPMNPAMGGAHASNGVGDDGMHGGVPLAILRHQTHGGGTERPADVMTPTHVAAGGGPNPPASNPNY